MRWLTLTLTCQPLSAVTWNARNILQINTLYKNYVVVAKVCHSNTTGCVPLNNRKMQRRRRAHKKKQIKNKNCLDMYIRWYDIQQNKTEHRCAVVRSFVRLNKTRHTHTDIPITCEIKSRHFQPVCCHTFATQSIHSYSNDDFFVLNPMNK